MRAVSVNEMYKIDGGVSWSAIKFGWDIGKYIGITARITYEHIRYGKCVTYKTYCPICH